MNLLPRTTSLFAVLLAVGIASAGDIARPGGRAADTQPLNLKPEGRTVAEETHWFDGYAGYPVGYSLYYSSPSHAFSYYSTVPAYSYYAPVYSYYYAPIYHSAPRVYYAPAIADRAIYPMSPTQEKPAQREEKSFRYDGDPKPAQKRIPPARLEEPAPEKPVAPATPADAKLGPAPMELKVSLPANSTPKKREYPVYGADRSKKSNDHTLLIRGKR